MCDHLFSKISFSTPVMRQRLLGFLIGLSGMENGALLMTICEASGMRTNCVLSPMNGVVNSSSNAATASFTEGGKYLQ